MPIPRWMVPGVAFLLVILAFAEGAFDALPDPPIEARPGEMLSQADRFYADGETTAALAMLDRVRQAWGTTAGYLVAVARVELAAGRLADAEQTLMDALERRYEELGRPFDQMPSWSDAEPYVPTEYPNSPPRGVSGWREDEVARQEPALQIRPLQMMASPFVPKEVAQPTARPDRGVRFDPLALPGTDDPVVRAGFATLAALEMERAARIGRTATPGAAATSALSSAVAPLSIGMPSAEEESVAAVAAPDRVAEARTVAIEAAMRRATMYQQRATGAINRW